MQLEEAKIFPSEINTRTFINVELSTGSVIVPDNSMSEEETFSTGVLETGGPVNGTTTFEQDQTFEPVEFPAEVTFMAASRSKVAPSSCIPSMAGVR